MKKEHLEHFLNKGYELGWRNSVDDPARLSWTLIGKRQPDERYLSLLDHEEEPEFVAQQEILRLRPYQVQVIEIDRAAYESGQAKERDCRFNEVLYLTSLDEVEEFIRKFGNELENVRWRHEIDAPA